MTQCQADIIRGQQFGTIKFLVQIEHFLICIIDWQCNWRTHFGSQIESECHQETSMQDLMVL